MDHVVGSFPSGISKKENIWTNVPEVSSSDDVKDGGKEEVSDICIATKTDGKPCGGIKYKDTEYCYNHLMQTKVRPRGRPPKVIADLAPVVLTPCAAPVPANAGDQIVAPRPDFVPEGPATRASHITEPRAPSRVVSPRSSSNDLVEKLSIKLKQKVDGLDDEMKLLLRMLL
jgi:hypothetical protein